MAKDIYTPEQIAAGEIELEQVLGELAKTGLTKASAKGKKRSKFPYYPTNLAALIIHQRNGGWIADVLFRGLPKGLGNVLGSPERAPFFTRREAYEYGVMVIAHILMPSPPPRSTKDLVVIIG